jgi:hypothetical protein
MLCKRIPLVSKQTYCTNFVQIIFGRTHFTIYQYMHDICVTTRYDESITGGRHFNYISITMTNIKVEQNQYRKSDNIEKVKPSDIETLTT